MINLFSYADVIVSLSLLFGWITCIIIAKEDLRSRIIPNKYLFILLIFGMLRHSFSTSLLEFSINVAIGLGIIVVTFPLYAYGKMGAGDVKFFGVSLFYCGHHLLPEYFMTLMLCGFVISIISLSDAAKYAWYSFTNLLRIPRLQSLMPTPTSIPFGVPIAATILIGTFPFLKISV